MGLSWFRISSRLRRTADDSPTGEISRTKSGTQVLKVRNQSNESRYIIKYLQTLYWPRKNPNERIQDTEQKMTRNNDR